MNKLVSRGIKIPKTTVKVAPRYATGLTCMMSLMASIEVKLRQLNYDFKFHYGKIQLCKIETRFALSTN